jgi:DNA-binding NtrC family response regulator
MPPRSPVALIIEDDPSSAEALALLLRDWGAEVVQASSDVSVAALSPRYRDLSWIITDFQLGDGANGVTLATQLTKLAPQARVLVLSGSFHGRAMTAAEEAGFEVMQKPARADAIIAWLERA